MDSTKKLWEIDQKTPNKDLQNASSNFTIFFPTQTRKTWKPQHPEGFLKRLAAPARPRVAKAMLSNHHHTARHCRTYTYDDDADDAEADAAAADDDDHHYHQKKSYSHKHNITITTTSTTAAASTTLQYNCNYNYIYNSATLHSTSPNCTTLHHHYAATTTTTATTATTTKLQLQLHQLQLQLHYNTTATATTNNTLHYTHTTLHPAVVVEVTTASTPKSTTPTTFRSINGFALPSMHHKFTTTHLS